jgi:glutamate 5-kinase
MSAETKVVKLGSELVSGEFGVEQEVIDGYAAGLVETYGSSGLVVVTSGAVKAGRAIVRAVYGKEVENFEEPTLAQIGNVAVMASWQVGFGVQGVLAGEILTTHQEIEDLTEGPVLVETLMMAADRGVVSIVNNNDANSRDELESFHQGKDNDRMGLHLALAIGASLLGIFTKDGGVFDDDGKLIEEINQSNYDDVMFMLVSRESRGEGISDGGKGGIISKVRNSWEAARAGVPSFIAAPNEDMTGKNVTRFVW